MAVKALSIAGFDPSAGAGALADVRTFNRYGVYGAAVLTAITFQNTYEVESVLPLQPDHVRRQMEVLTRDMDFDAVKTGMLANSSIVEVVASALRDGHFKNIVVDPVIRSSSGAVLLDEEGVRSMVEEIFPLATLVTPNVPEAEIVSGMDIESVEDMEKAAKRILEMGPQAVLIKGGHGPQLVDILVTRHGKYTFSGERVKGDVHGSGCVLASSIAALLALGHDVLTATSTAVTNVRAAFHRTLRVGKGRSVLF